MKLQKAAASLLSFLELKVGGQNPDEFSNTLQPTLDATEFYAAPNQITVVASGNVTIPGDFVNLNVPAGFAYRVRAVGFVLTLAAATTGVDGAGGSMFYNPGNTGAPLYECHSTPKVTAANAWILSGGVMLPRPFIALPGTRVFFQNDRVYSVASNVDVRILVDQLQYP